MEVILGKIMALFVLPPGLNLVLALFGLLLRWRFYRTGTFMIYFSFILLYIFSIPLFSTNLIRSQQPDTALDVGTLGDTPAKVIVVLGGGRYIDAPEYKEDTVSIYALERIRYGAYLQRKTKLPILFTGGVVYSEGTPEAVLMKKVLEDAFIGVAHWVEDRSRTTYENALYTQEMLAKENIQDIILVTHAYHMTRSVEAFEQMGFKVTPAPMGFVTPDTRPLLMQLLPRADALETTSAVMHEWIGRLWYQLRYYRSRPS